MSSLWLIVKGMFMGIANIIPGVSGGTMAVSLGIYDDLIFSITHIVKEWRKSLKLLVPLGIGLAGGIVFFAYTIEILLSQYAFPTFLAFIGLILGGLPILYREFQDSLKSKGEQISTSHILAFSFFLILVIVLSLVQDPSSTTSSIDVSFKSMIVLFLIGVIASATMVVPGISGSLVLMILGYYYSIINALTNFFDSLRAFDWEGIVNGLAILVPFGIGVILGIFLISKIIEYLFINFPSLTYSSILGLVVASPVAIIYNTGAITDFSQTSSVVYIIIGIVLLLASFYLTYQLSFKEEVDFK